jgi:HlyD family secretion protein
MKLIPGLTANCNISIEDRKNVLKIPTNAFAFHPPVEYIQQAPLLSDSMKTFWLQKIRSTDELQKRQIVETMNATGYLWIKQEDDIFPVEVTKGLNDGTFTEISGKIKEGFEVVTGINHSATASEGKSSQSPFMPKFPSSKK